MGSPPGFAVSVTIGERESYRVGMFPRLLACLLVVAGCGNAIEDRLVGAWVFDLEQAERMPSFQARTPAEQEELRRDFATTSYELRFTEEGRAFLNVTAAGTTVRAGVGSPYRAVAKEGGGFEIEVERAAGGVDRYDAAFEGETLYVWFGKRKRPFRRQES
jgi:hypothetical protein